MTKKAQKPEKEAPEAEEAKAPKPTKAAAPENMPVPFQSPSQEVQASYQAQAEQLQMPWEEIDKYVSLFGQPFLDLCQILIRNKGMTPETLQGVIKKFGPSLLYLITKWFQEMGDLEPSVAIGQISAAHMGTEGAIANSVAQARMTLDGQMISFLLKSVVVTPLLGKLPVELATLLRPQADEIVNLLVGMLQAKGVLSAVQLAKEYAKMRAASRS